VDAGVAAVELPVTAAAAQVIAIAVVAKDATKKYLSTQEPYESDDTIDGFGVGFVRPAGGLPVVLNVTGRGEGMETEVKSMER